MKYLLILLLFTSAAAYSQSEIPVNTGLLTFSANKEYKDTTGNYLIKYQVDQGYAYVPLTVGGAPHYNATIEVYKILNRDTVLIGGSIKGTYVREGCYEDIPREWVEKAKKLNAENSYRRVGRIIPIYSDAVSSSSLKVDTSWTSLKRTELEERARIKAKEEQYDYINKIMKDSYEFEKVSIAYINTVPDYWKKGPAWIKLKKVLLKNGYIIKIKK